MPYIYKIENKINHKIYIGKTSGTIQNRWNEHWKDSIKFPERILYKAFAKYGKDSFSIEQVEEIENDKIACERECFWIEFYGSFKEGYNSTLGGDGAQYADYDQIFRLFNEGKTNFEIQKITNYSNNTITLALSIKGISEEERKQRGYDAKRKTILALDPTTLDVVKIFSSIAEAYLWLGKEKSGHIAQVCQGKRKTAYGYVWSY